MKKPLLTLFLVAIALALFSTYFLGTNTTELNSTRSAIYPQRGSMGMSAGDMAVSEKSMIAPMPPVGGGSDAMMVSDRAVSYSSYHSVVVTDVSEYTKNLREFITSVKGQVLSSSQGKSDLYDYASLYAKVPVTAFDQTTLKITENTKKIMSESINTADRTSEVVSNADQLERIRAEIAVKEAELTETTVQSEKTRIQTEITRLQRQLESLQQQSQNIQEQVEYATIQISVSNKELYFDPQADIGIIETIKEAIRSLRGTFKLMLVITIWIAVYSVILVPLYFFVRWLKNKFTPVSQ